MISTVNYKGTSIRFQKEGKGEKTLVLLHGFCEAIEIWGDLVRYLSKENCVISIDLLGHGKSGCLSDTHIMEEMASAVKTVLDFCKLKSCVMIGHSMGGYVALAFAELYPKYLKGIGLFHSTAYADTLEKKFERIRTIEVVRKNQAFFIREFSSKLFALKSKLKFKEDYQNVSKIIAKTPLEGVTAALNGMMKRKDRSKLLRKLSIPVLFIIGKHDLIFSLEKSLEIIKFPRHSEALVLENAGHMGFIEAKKETFFTVKKFVEFCYI